MQHLLQKTGYVVALLLFAVGLVTVVRGPQGLRALEERRKEIRALQEDNADITRENEQKRNRIKRLGNSLSEQELVIRERLKLVRPGETSFILPDAKPAQ